MGKKRVLMTHQREFDLVATRRPRGMTVIEDLGEVGGRRVHILHASVGAPTVVQ